MSGISLVTKGMISPGRPGGSGGSGGFRKQDETNPMPTIMARGMRSSETEGYHMGPPRAILMPNSNGNGITKEADKPKIGQAKLIDPDE